MVEISPFKDWKGKTRFQVKHGMRFLGGGFASEKSAEKYVKYVKKHKRDLGIE